MRTIVHLSDLHFGSIDDALMRPLIEIVTALKPDVVAVSGDLTQRARMSQFKEARAFLDALPKPQIVVPGNHDIPLDDLVSPFAFPLSKYRKYVTSDFRPIHSDDEMVVLGINTARSFTIKGGRISKEQVAWVRERLREIGSNVIKVVVTHHPFDLPDGFDRRGLVGRARSAMTTLSSCGIDLFLAGHMHVSHPGHAWTGSVGCGQSALVVQAGTATSTRGRGDGNSFNVIRLAHPRVSVERLIWQPDHARFVTSNGGQFHQTREGWSRIATAV